MMIQSKNLWLLAVPAAFLVLSGCGGGSDNGPTTPVPTVTPIATSPPPTGVVYDNRGTYSAIAGNSNVNSVRFVANQSNVLQMNANSTVLTLTDQQSIIQSRRFRLTGPFGPSSVGQTFPIASVGGPGVATVDYEQNDGGTLSRWQANGGNIIIDNYMLSNTVGVDATVRFRLVNATFVPSTNLDNGDARGTFTFNVNGAIQ